MGQGTLPLHPTSSGRETTEYNRLPHTPTLHPSQAQLPTTGNDRHAGRETSPTLDTIRTEKDKDLGSGSGSLNLLEVSSLMLQNNQLKQQVSVAGRLLCVFTDVTDNVFVPFGSHLIFVSCVV